jgi:hypothetical protein
MPQNNTNKKYITEMNDTNPKMYFLKKFSVLYFILSTIVTAVNMIIVIINAKIINSAADS